MPFAVENLQLYQKAVDFADDVLATTEHFPRGDGFLADRLNRASDSIAGNGQRVRRSSLAVSPPRRRPQQ